MELLKWFINMHQQIINICEMDSNQNLKDLKADLQYLDANNLYGWAMSQPLPAGGFKWVDVNPNEISELATRTAKGYILTRGRC